MKRACYPIFLIFCFLSVFESDVWAQGKFNQLGYFKDSKKNRIYTISFKQGTSRDEVYKYAERLLFTEGQMMAAYFYPEGSSIPADGVTLAKTIFQANNVLYDMKGPSCWRYAFMRSYKGTKAFVDCLEDPDNDLCREFQ